MCLHLKHPFGKGRLLTGFTLIEVLAAIFLITVGVMAALIVINQTTVFTQVTSSRLVASYLAQEGIEIVKNIRDTNFLKIHKGVGGVNWDDNILCCGTPPCQCEADYDDSALVSADRYLKLDGGFYNYDSVTDTVFKRKIIIFDLIDLDDPPDGIPDQMKVQVLVSWQERGREHKVTAQENLYLWLQ